MTPGEWFVQDAIPFLKEHFALLFTTITIIIAAMVDSFISVLTTLHPITITIIVTIIAYLLSGKGAATLSVLGFSFITWLGLWTETMQTLSLVLTATIIAIILAIPLGVLKARSRIATIILDPILDFMQTLPTLIYLIPAVLFFRIGNVPGVVATLIFAMPPAIRLTAHGIEQVSEHLVEVGRAYGATPRQLLFKIRLPTALPAIMVGVNQTIMLTFSMVVIAGFIGAQGLQEVIISGITRYQLAPAIDAGLAIVFLAVLLDRITKRPGGKTPLQQLYAYCKRKIMLAKARS